MVVPPAHWRGGNCVEYASHPIMAQALKYDQSLLRTIALKRPWRRQALLGLLFLLAVGPNVELGQDWRRPEKANKPPVAAKIHPAFQTCCSQAGPG